MRTQCVKDAEANRPTDFERGKPKEAGQATRECGNKQAQPVAARQGEASISSTRAPCKARTAYLRAKRGRARRAHGAVGAPSGLGHGARRAGEAVRQARLPKPSRNRPSQRREANAQDSTTVPRRNMQTTNRTAIATPRSTSSRQAGESASTSRGKRKPTKA